MVKTRCRFCHEEVDSLSYPLHVEEHLKRRPDGQQQEYATLAPEELPELDLQDEPRWYVHRRCGVVTGMPEEIIRTYLVNPYFYLADATFCHGCHTHVPMSECDWTETGENLQTYTDRLRAGKPECRPDPLTLAVTKGISAARRLFSGILR